VPYKRYTRESIEPVLDDGPEPEGPDESTLKRWRTWFRESISYITGCLQAIAARITNKPAETPVAAPVLHRVWQLIGSETGWLSQIVRSLSNAGLWIHTRSALLAR
jgi:hypothetical protein